MKTVTLYHNPRCSKSRQALQLLNEHGVAVKVVEYLKDPLDASALTALLKKLQRKARDVIRKTEAPYKDLQLNNTQLSEKALIQAIAEHPILMQRPIAVCGAKAAIGRPPEDVLAVVG